MQVSTGLAEEPVAYGKVSQGARQLLTDQWCTAVRVNYRLSMVHMALITSACSARVCGITSWPA